MIDRIILKIREILHYLIHLNIYKGSGVILRGVPKILYGNKIRFGKNVRINDNVFMHAAEGISIGDNTTLSYGVSLLTESYDVKNYDRYIQRHHSGAPINIGKNVWICANVTVLPGVVIADNTIIAAGSVVTKSLLEENALYAGNPARFIKKMEWE